MELLFGDSKDILPNLTPDVILIDTMYNDRKKTALVQKGVSRDRYINSRKSKNAVVFVKGLASPVCPGSAAR